MDTITWLHLSDLHFRAREDRGWDEGIVLAALLHDVTERIDLDGLQPDFTVVSGDIAFSGKAPEYDLAGTFFDELLQITRLGKDRLFIVPGNHDVDRSLVSTDARHVDDALQDRETVNDVLGDPGDRSLILARFGAYADFVNHYFGESLPFNDQQYFYVRKLNLAGKHVAIVGLNSALLSGSEDDERRGLVLGERQVRTALEQAQDADTRVAVLHHPLDLLRRFDRKDAEPLLWHDCDFLLHGHMHQVGLLLARTPDSDVIVIATGAAYERRRFPNSYNIVKLDLISGTGAIYLRRYSDAGRGFWTEDTLSYKNVSNGRYNFPLEVTSPQSAYPRYLEALVSELHQWETRYAPMFARFEKLTLFARISATAAAEEPLLDLIGRRSPIVVLGVAGAGKTTALRRLALDKAREALDGKSTAPIPVLVPLRDYGPPNVETLIARNFWRWGLSSQRVHDDLGKGGFLLVFDGLNEVAESRREDCLAELRHLMNAFPHNRYVFSARPVGYRADCLAVGEVSPAACTILPLTRGQIKDYVQRYFSSQESIASELLDQLRLDNDEVWKKPESLVHLAEVPLLLQMLILTFEARLRIPGNVGELLLEFTTHILGEREPGKRAGHFRAELKKQLLGSVAWAMHERGMVSAAPRPVAWEAFVGRLRELQDARETSPDYAADDIWEEIQNNHLLIDTDVQVAWPHPLFQDLFVGLELRGLCFDSGWSPNWSEVAYRFSPLRATWFGTPLFDYGIRMLQIVPREFRASTLVAVSCHNPSLAYQAYLQMEPEYDPELRDAFLTGVHEAALSAERSSNQHCNLVQTLGHFDDVGATRELLKELAERCPTPQGRREALSVMWRKDGQAPDRSYIELIKNISENDPADEVRIAALDYLVRTDDDGLLSFLADRLLRDTDLVAHRLLQSLGEKRRSPVVLEKLSQSARSIHGSVELRRRAIWLLGESGAPDTKIRELLRKIAEKDSHATLRRGAVASLRGFTSRATVNTLGRTASDPERMVRLESIRSLRASARFNTTPPLIAALADGDEDVGAEAVEALLEISTKPGLLEALADAARDSDPLIRRRALTAIARIAVGGQRNAVAAAKELQGHQGERDEQALLEVATGLHHYDPGASVVLLRRLLASDMPAVRQIAEERCEELGLSTGV
jgi:HEAT repeat protein